MSQWSGILTRSFLLPGRVPLATRHCVWLGLVARAAAMRLSVVMTYLLLLWGIICFLFYLNCQLSFHEVVGRNLLFLSLSWKDIKYLSFRPGWSGSDGQNCTTKNHPVIYIITLFKQSDRWSKFSWCDSVRIFFENLPKVNVNFLSSLPIQCTQSLHQSWSYLLTLSDNIYLNQSKHLKMHV